MNIHENARTTPASRALLNRRVRRERWSIQEAAEAAGISRRTAYKWLRRFAEEGSAGLRDRPSRAHRLPHAVPAEWTDLIAYLRQFRQPARLIAHQLGMARSTVSAVLSRRGLGPLRALEAPLRPCRYERRRPGDLIHLDIKKLGRFWRPGHRVTGDRTIRSEGSGWDYIHVAIDDHSRLAYVEILEDELSATCVDFMHRALTWFAEQSIPVRRVLTDNGVGYRAHRFRIACEQLKIRHLRTRPHHPQTNGKAERFIQTLMREWAYGRVYSSSHERAKQLPLWIRYYNYRRPHGSLDHKPPISRRPSSCDQRS
jgi:transposase InsO family protein